MDPAIRTKRSKRLLSIVHLLLLLAVYGFLTFKAFVAFSPDWDFLVYHLPGTLRLYHLTKYLPEPHLRPILAGFPPLPYAIGGALVAATGRLSTANSANAILVLFTFFGLYRLYGAALSWRWFFTAVLSIPLVVTHFTSGYVDLATGMMLLLAFAALLKLELDRRDVPNSRSLFWFTVGAAGAMLCKYQAWPIVFFFTLAVLIRLTLHLRVGRLSGGRFCFWAVAILTCVSVWPVRNIVRFNNPTYPYEAPAIGRFFPNYRYPAQAGDRPYRLAEESNVAAFFISSLELNRLMSDEPFHWSIDQAHGTGPENPHNRLGGWFFLSYGTLLLLFLFVFLRALMPFGPALAFICCVASTAVLPTSYELRYWLYIPLVLCFIMGWSLERLPAIVGNTVRGIILFSAVYVLLKTDAFALEIKDPAEYAPPDAREFWRTHPPETTGKTEICGHTPFTIFWSGPTFREYEVEACR